MVRPAKYMYEVKIQKSNACNNNSINKVKILYK